MSLDYGGVKVQRLRWITQAPQDRNITFLVSELIRQQCSIVYEITKINEFINIDTFDKSEQEWADKFAFRCFMA
jgi:hypothetical protein